MDFDDAIRLPNGGSTCDIYRTRWQRREVFVKKLKDEYKTNPLYLDALDKEYEIGASLKHPSLPDYRGFHRDYIVMDFIDGETLAERIKNNDPWLKNEKNIIRLLRELVDVTDYLHRHNITHCDIKPDNIMITANNHNVVLIDLDKCYTDALNDTSGDPSRYGLTFEEKGRIVLDFYGISGVVETLKEKIPSFKFRKYNEFVKECKRKDCNADKLLEILDYTPVNYLKKYKWLITIAPFVGAVVFGAVLWLTQKAQEAQDNDNSYKDINEAPETLPAKNDTIVFLPAETQEDRHSTEKKVDVPPPITREQLHLEAKEMAAQFDKKIQPYFDILNEDFDSLISFSNKSGITGTELLEALRKHDDKADEYLREAFAVLDETYPGLTDRARWRVMSYSKAYTGYKRRAEPILRELGQKVIDLGGFDE